VGFGQHFSAPLPSSCFFPSALFIVSGEFAMKNRRHPALAGLTFNPGVKNGRKPPSFASSLARPSNGGARNRGRASRKNDGGNFYRGTTKESARHKLPAMCQAAGGEMEGGLQFAGGRERPHSLCAYVRTFIWRLRGGARFLHWRTREENGPSSFLSLGHARRAKPAFHLGKRKGLLWDGPEKKWSAKSEVKRTPVLSARRQNLDMSAISSSLPVWKHVSTTTCVSSYSSRRRRCS